MSRPPEQYVNFVLAVAALSAFVGIVLGMLMERFDNPKSCPICADIVREHTKAFRAANRLSNAGHRARRQMQDAARDDLGDFEEDDWENSRAR